MNMTPNAQGAASREPAAAQDTLTSGILIGLLPLGLLLVGLLIALALDNIGYRLTITTEFFTREKIMLALHIAGLAIITVAYVAGCVSVMRRIMRWQRSGLGRRAAGALWIVGATGVLTLLPLLLAILAQ